MKIPSIIKNNIGFISALALLLILYISVDARSLMIKGLMETGIYTPSMPETKTLATSNSLKEVPPGLSFVNLEGKVIELSEQKGKVVFINFWATWCPPCRAEMPSINKLYNQLKDNKNVVFLMVDVDSKLKDSEKFMERKSYQLPVVGAASSIPDWMFSGALPTTLIIAPDGKIVFKHSGVARYDRPQVLEFIKGLLQ
ncbi:MAG TPA: TlpA disulfide reductase family protein [Daejeonella sp.]|nr:TlpA disulfide reductase family protein [Daejeonella sp.]